MLISRHHVSTGRQSSAVERGGWALNSLYLLERLQVQRWPVAFSADGAVGGGGGLPACRHGHCHSGLVRMPCRLALWHTALPAACDNLAASCNGVKQSECCTVAFSYHAHEPLGDSQCAEAGDLVSTRQNARQEHPWPAAGSWRTSSSGSARCTATPLSSMWSGARPSGLISSDNSAWTLSC